MGFNYVVDLCVWGTECPKTFLRTVHSCCCTNLNKDVFSKPSVYLTLNTEEQIGGKRRACRVAADSESTVEPLTTYVSMILTKKCSDSVSMGLDFGPPFVHCLHHTVLLSWVHYLLTGGSTRPSGSVSLNKPPAYRKTAQLFFPSVNLLPLVN